jgi:hypothetical protein
VDILNFFARCDRIEPGFIKDDDGSAGNIDAS